MPGVTMKMEMQEQSVLFKLPPEIRNQIYNEYALARLYDPHEERFRKSGPNDPVVISRACHYPDLLLSCQRVAKEAGALIFSKARICFDTHHVIVWQTSLMAPGWARQPSLIRELFINWAPLPTDLREWMNLSYIRTKLEDQFGLATGIEKLSLTFDWPPRWKFCAPGWLSRSPLPRLKRKLWYFILFILGLPNLKQIELRGVFPESWAGYLQIITGVKVISYIDPPPVNKRDTLGWLRTTMDNNTNGDAADDDGRNRDGNRSHVDSHAAGD